MAVEITIPSVGESITEGTIGRWLKADGAAVTANEPILELETDKATQEIVAPTDGILSITVKEGEKVAIGSVVGHVDPAGKPAPKPAAVPAKTANAPPPPPNADMPLSPAVR